MRFVANGLARRGYTVHGMQMAFHGGLNEDLKDTTCKDWFNSVQEALLELPQSYDVVFAGGLSTGAILNIGRFSFDFTRPGADSRETLQGSSAYLRRP